MKENGPKLPAIRVAGFLLWRAGLITVAISSFYYSAWWLLSFLVLPAQVLTGAALIGAGVMMLTLSLVMERYRDRKLEDLSE